MEMQAEMHECSNSEMWYRLWSLYQHRQKEHTDTNEYILACHAEESLVG